MSISRRYSLEPTEMSIKTHKAIDVLAARLFSSAEHSTFFKVFLVDISRFLNHAVCTQHMLLYHLQFEQILK